MMVRRACVIRWGVLGVCRVCMRMVTPHFLGAFDYFLE